MQQVSDKACKRYRDHREILTDHVNRYLAQRPDIQELIGGNALSLMYTNHAHHHAFMSEVFTFNKPEMLIRMVPWVYRAYLGQGFSGDYFLREFEAWIEAIQEHIPSVADEILPWYIWFQEQHDSMMEKSRQTVTTPQELLPSYKIKFDAFVTALLRGDSKQVLDLGNLYVEDSQSLVAFYLEMIQPALYRIGDLWQQGTISVAQEHLASGIINRVMAYWYFHVLNAKKTRGKAVVTSAANEFHAIGGHMVADLLATHGWEVIHLGANTPVVELVQVIESFEPDLVAISVCMPFNLSAAKEMIQLARKASSKETIKIMVGGQAFNLSSDLWQAVGADGWGTDGYKAVSLAASWHDESKTVQA